MPLYLIAIAWVYITLLMALTERSFVAGIATFVIYGLLPLALVLWLLDAPARRRRRRPGRGAPPNIDRPRRPDSTASADPSAGNPDD